MYVEDELVFYNEPLENQDDMFDFMADKLEQNQYITRGFREAIKKREKEYPTGMELNGLNVAITHTEKEHANADKLVIIMPENPIIFRSIEHLCEIKVDLIFGIVLNNSEGHLEVLKKISQMFQEEEVVKKIKNIHSRKELSIYMQKYFN